MAGERQDAARGVHENTAPQTTMHHPLPATTALFEHLADAVYLLDPDSSNIVWGNRRAWESLGLTREQVLDHSVLSLQMDVTGLPAWSDIAAVIRATPCYTFVGRHRHALGHEVQYRRAFGERGGVLRHGRLG